MARNRRYQQDDDWARQVPQRRWEGPYDDYGWESGQSGLPQFRDPEVHSYPEERRWHRAGRQGPYDYDEDYNWPGQDLYQSPTTGENSWDVPGPYAGMGPRGYQRSDERIKEDVCERLTQHGFVDASDIEVDVKDHEVTLNGTVPDRRMKRMAENAADSVPGVEDVHNHLHLNKDRERGARSQSGVGRREEVGGSGVYPASDPNAPPDSQAQGMASWGQGERGAEGYHDSGSSELHLDE